MMVRVGVWWLAIALALIAAWALLDLSFFE
jgi:hypothetical protein